jgi:hypothetical protein
MNLFGQSINLQAVGESSTLAPISTSATVNAATTVAPTSTEWVSVSGPYYGPSGVYSYDVGNALVVSITYYPSEMAADFFITNNLPGMPDISRTFNCTKVGYTFNATFGETFSGMPDVVLDVANSACLATVQSYFDVVTGPQGISAFTASYDETNNLVLFNLFNALTTLNAVNYGPLGAYVRTEGAVEAQLTFYQYSMCPSPGAAWATRTRLRPRPTRSASTSVRTAACRTSRATSTPSPGRTRNR